MIEEQYEMIMDLHGPWIDRSLGRACQELLKRLPSSGPWSPIEFASKVRDYKEDMPQGIQTIPAHHFLALIERRLEVITASGLAKKGRPRQGWNTYEVMDVLDALAAL